MDEKARKELDKKLCGKSIKEIRKNECKECSKELGKKVFQKSKCSNEISKKVFYKSKMELNQNFCEKNKDKSSEYGTKISRHYGIRIKKKPNLAKKYTKK